MNELHWAIYFLVLGAMVIYLRAIKAGNNPTAWALGFIAMAVIAFWLNPCMGPVGAFIIAFKFAAMPRRPPSPWEVAPGEDADRAGQ